MRVESGTSHYTLPQVNVALRGACRKLFPEVEGLFCFSPPVDLDFADLASDCAIHIGAAARRAPADVARLILAELPQPLRDRMNEKGGYLNLRLTDRELLAENFWSDELPTRRQEELPTVIIVPPPAQNLNGWGSLRLLAAATMQLAMIRALGARARLVIANEIAVDFQQPVLDAIRAWLERATTAGLPQTEIVAEGLRTASTLCSSSDRVTLWLASYSLPRGDFRRLLSAFAATAMPPRVVSIDRLWLTPIESADPPAALLHRATSADLAALCLCLAAPVPAQDLDLGVARLPEQGNLGWWARRTLERLERVMADSSSRPAAACHGGERSATAPALPANFRALLLRVRTLPAQWFRAAAEGDVRSAVAAMHELLECTVRVLNQPSFRQRAAHTALTGSESEILTGVRCAISDIITFTEMLARSDFYMGRSLFSR